MRHVIIGSSAAGISAAREIRRLREDAEIIMISRDGHVHSRCMLHKYISHERDVKGLDFTEDNFFETQRVEYIQNEVISVQEKEKCVVLRTGEEIPYDRLLIASGAQSFIPPVGDLRTAPNVCGMRDLSDAQTIDRMAESADNILVIGAGLVGMDAAYGLLQRGKRVTVLEMSHRILPVQLDAHSAEVYQREFESRGAIFYLGRRLEKTICGVGGQICRVVLDTGENIDCDMIIVAAGVRPAIDFLDNSGVEAGRGVLVDAGLQTNVKDIYAAGDVIGHSAIWPNAVKQGIVAARNMCGMSEKYTDTFNEKNMMNFFGIVTLYLGQICTRRDEVVMTEEDRNVYRRISIRDGKVTGILLQGDISNAGVWQYLIKNQIDISNIKENVFQISYADFFSVKADGEYRWNYQRQAAE